MPLHEMAVEPGLEGKASLQVHGLPDLPGAQRGFGKRLINGRNAVQGISDLLHGEADAIMAHTLINL